MLNGSNGSGRDERPS